MDDFPAGPACPEARGPALSVVVPVRNGGDGLGRCLRALRASTFQDYELIVVDDGSDDGSGELAGRYGARVIRHDRALGPAAARNAGAEAASAPLVFFLDADAVPHAETLGRAVAHFERRPALAALFGSYDDAPDAPGLVSQYRNLLHHFVHQQGVFQDEIRPAHTFWTGCGVIRREAFRAVGGFDPRLYRRPAIEDIELGYRLTRAGHNIGLARDVQVQHLKRWTLRGVVRTDVLHRGVPWMVLMLRSRVAETDLNVSPGQRRSVALVGAALAALVLAPWSPRLGVFGALLLAGPAWLNREFYRFLARRRGLGFAIAAYPLHLAYFVCCGVSVVLALGMVLFGPRPEGAVQEGRVDGAERARPAGRRFGRRGARSGRT